MSNEIHNAVIQQINLGYNTNEDRVLLRIGMSDDVELTVWLTRRVVKTLWHLLQNTSVASTLAPGSQQVLKSFARESAAQSAAQKLDFSEEYKQRASANKDEILLVLDCQLDKPVKTAPTLKLICTNGQTLQLVLNLELILALINMLQLVIKEAAWDVESAEHASLLNPATVYTVLH